MSSTPSYFDVCIFCALREEAIAVIEIFSDRCGVEFKNEFQKDDSAYRYTTLSNDWGESLNVLLSWPPYYGDVDAALCIKSVLDEFQPRFAAMTGFCAGDKRKVKLGDIIVAERAFTYDSGKITEDEQGQRQHLHDTNTYHPDRKVLQFVLMFDEWQKAVVHLPRPPSKRQQRDWLLSTLLEQTTPRINDIKETDLKTYVPAWQEIIKKLQAGSEPYLTKEGRLRDKAQVTELRFSEGFPFKDPPQAKCYIKPMASGKAVRGDNPFDKVQYPVRGTVAIDMEAAAFYRTVADYRDIRSLLVKGVCDYADSDKDDSYHQYAAQASAAYMLRLIQEYSPLRKPTEWDKLKEKFRCKCKKWSGDDFWQFCKDWCEAQGYELQFPDVLGSSKEAQFLAIQKSATGSSTWLVKCVHSPRKKLEKEDIDRIFQSPPDHYDGLPINGCWLITSGYWSKDAQNVFHNIPKGKKLVGPSKIAEVLQNHPTLLKKYIDLEPPGDESELSNHYELLEKKLFNDKDAASAEDFYKGSMGGWRVVQSGLDVEREVCIIKGTSKTPNLKYDKLRQLILSLSEGKQKGLSFVLITSEAGGGKTTLLFRLGYDLYKRQNDEHNRYRVLRLTGDALLDCKSLVKFGQANGKHLYVLVDIYDAERYKDNLKEVTYELSKQNVSVTIIAAARSNEWRRIGTIEARKKFEVKLGKLSKREAEGLLDLLGEHKQLGKLENLSRTEQLNEFLSPKAADKQLLVALMEATHGQRFEEILEEEYDNLQPDDDDKVQWAYGFVCLFYSYGILLPIDLLGRVLDMNELDLYKKILPPARLVIIKDFDRPDCVRARHRRIAQVLKERKLLGYLLPMLRKIISCVKEYRETDRYALLKFLLGFVSDQKELVKKVLEEKRDKIRSIQSQVRDIEQRYIELAEWGYLYYKLGDLNMDRQFLSDALEIAPAGSDAAKLCYYYGMVLEKLKYEDDKIRRYFKKAYEWNLRSKEFLHHYLLFEIRNNGLEKVIEILEEILTNELDNNVIRRLAHGLSNRLIKEKKYNEAIKVCKVGLKARNDGMRMRMRYRLTALEQRNEPGDNVSALEEYEKVIKHRPDYVMASQKIEREAKSSGWTPPPVSPVGPTLEDVIQRFDELDLNLVNLEAKLDNLQLDQKAIYSHLSVQNQVKLEEISTEVRQGRVEQAQISNTVEAIRRVLKYSLETEAITDAEIQQYLADIYQAVNSDLSFQQKLELSLPIIPFLLEYKVGLGAGVDLKAVWQELLERIRS